MNAKWKLTWDYSGWRNPDDSPNKYNPYTQQDWNQTLVTKVNQISAQIYQANMRGGANKIKVHPRIFSILMTLEFFKVTDEGLFVLSGRYIVDIDKDNPIDKVYVYQDNYPMEPFVSDESLTKTVWINSESPLLNEYKEQTDIQLIIVTPDRLVGEITIRQIDWLGNNN